LLVNFGVELECWFVDNEIPCVQVLSYIFFLLCQDDVHDTVSTLCSASSPDNNQSVIKITHVVERDSITVNPAVAAGQIYEIGTDGRLTVEWADGSRTKCFPHQLYLVSDEVCMTAIIVLE
jgi:hypothetical protein